jgi:hypothetical protein
VRVTTRSDVPCTRHPGDVVRLGLGSIVLAGCSLVAALTRVTGFETALLPPELASPRLACLHGVRTHERDHYRLDVMPS